MSEGFKWRLTWISAKDSPELRGVVEYMKTFPLFRDSKARLVNFEEYSDLVRKGEIAPPESYWQIEEGKVGLISLSAYNRYTNTWDKISIAKEDFLAGVHFARTGKVEW